MGFEPTTSSLESGPKPRDDEDSISYAASLPSFLSLLPSVGREVNSIMNSRTR
jgi:hypothetical protein